MLTDELKIIYENECKQYTYNATDKKSTSSWFWRNQFGHKDNPYTIGWKNDLGERNTQNTVYRNGNRYSKFVIREVSQVLLTNKVT